MANKRGRPLGATAGGEKKIKRQLYIDEALFSRMKAYAATFPVRIADSAIIEAALKEFLDKHEKRI